MRQVGQPFNPFLVFYGIYIPEALLRYPGLSSAAKLCYGVLCRYAGDKGRCWPSQDHVATALGGVSVRNVRRHLKELESKGFIRVVQIGLQRNNEYEFLWHEIFTGSERTDLSAQDRTRPSAQDRTGQSAPSKKESLKESAAAKKSASSSPNPSLFKPEGRPMKTLSRIQPEETEIFLEWMREAERRGAIK